MLEINHVPYILLESKLFEKTSFYTKYPTVQEKKKCYFYQFVFFKLTNAKLESKSLDYALFISKHKINS